MVPASVEALNDDPQKTMMRIIPAQTEFHYRRARQLFQPKADALGFDLELQAFSRELATLPGEYAPPILN